MTQKLLTRALVGVAISVAGTLLSGCEWKGANSLPLPGTEGSGASSYTIQAQLSDVDNIDRNSRVRVGDVNVGTVTKIERQGWHALLTMTVNGDVQLPVNSTAKIGQTSLLGSKHIELAAPTNVPAEGQLREGSVIPLSSAAAYPTTEKTLAALSLLLNGGGLGQIQDITQALSTAFAGRENDLRSLLTQLDIFVGHLNDQRDDIISATQSMKDLAGQVAEQRPVLDRALKTVPEALAVLKDDRQTLADALASLGKFSAVAVDAVDQTKDNLVNELEQLGPVLESLANSGPALTRSLSFFLTYPYPNETIENFARGDYANLTAVFDLTLSRLDSSLLTGTRFEGDLTELELQWGRTIGQLPSPYTAGNPLVVPYHWDQGR